MKIIQEFRALEKKDQVVFFLICSTISNFFIGIIKFVFSLAIPSFWFFINAVFSLSLVLCRFMTIKRYKVIRKIKDKEERLQQEYITYLVALIAFTSIGTAIYGMVKYTRNREPIIKGIKITNFANALTSIVLTQVVLLDTYAGSYDSTINGYTGMGVSLVIIILGLSMIITGKKDIEKD